MSSFEDLRKLADWLATRSAVGTSHLPSAIGRLVQRLGATAVPLLGRELAGREVRRRDAAREALAIVAIEARTRVIATLHEVAATASHDDAKVCALGLLSELGERGAARFLDPDAMQQRTAVALAHHLDTAADIASAADLMIRQLDDADLVQLVAVMADSAPDEARLLASELALRLDLDAEQRARVAEAVAPARERAATREVKLSSRPPQVAVLVDAAARLVVVACRKVPGERRWRRWAVLIGATGHVDDCLHEDDARDGDAAPLIANLVADGYRIASNELDHARDVVAAAAQLTAAALPSPYYLGRDLLELGDAHQRRATTSPSSPIGRAIELIAAGELDRAHALIERCDPASADVAAAAAACALARAQPAVAVEHLARAIAAEPDWPLHHWNLAAALHQLNDATGCHHALRRFVTTSAAPTGLYGDPDQPGRVARAERLMAELERTARLLARPMRGSTRRKSRTRAPARR